MAMINYQQSTSASASSEVDGSIVLMMNGTVESTGRFFTHKFIQDKDLYFANQDEADADFKEFENNIEAIAKKISTDE